MGLNSGGTHPELCQEALPQTRMHSLLVLQLLSLLAQAGPCVTTDSKVQSALSSS